MTPTKASTARASSSPANNLSKASDASLRSSRQQLPTIAGSPSVGPVNVALQPQPVYLSSANGNASGYGSIREKDTPTKIPRVAGRTSTTSSPQSSFKGPSSMVHTRRGSLNVSSMSNVSSNNTEVPPSPQNSSFANDFGVLDSSELGHKSGTATHAVTMTPRSAAVRASPQSVSRVPRQSAIPPAPSTVGSKRAIPRDSLYTGLRKPSTTSITSLSAATQEVNSVSSSTATLIQNSTPSANRLSTISPSKSAKALHPKSNLPTPRIVSSSGTSAVLHNGSPSSSRQSFSTPSPSPSLLDEDEIAADEEMMAYIRRTQARKLANGARQEDLDEMLKFPEPIPPVPSSSPAGKVVFTTMLDTRDADKGFIPSSYPQEQSGCSLI